MSTLQPGQMLSHYRLDAKIGEGGMGVVYLVEDVSLKRKVAIKVLPASQASDPSRLKRFQREAETIAALNHPHIVTIYSIETSEGIPFLTMEFVPGANLGRALRPAGLPLAKILDIGAALAEALAAAHEVGIIHRDLKPANVMVTTDARVKVLDFGLAKWVAETAHAAGAEDTQAVTRSAALTRERAVRGTVPYMSPEQLKGQTLDSRTDIFSLGVVLYEMATGRRPFQATSEAELVSSIIRDRPIPANEIRLDLPRDVGRIIGQCLEKEPRDRFQTARDVYNELRGLRKEGESEMPGKAIAPASSASGALSILAHSPLLLWAAGGAAAALALVAALWLGRGGSEPPRNASAGAPPAVVPPAAVPPASERAATASAVALQPAVASVAVLPFADMSSEKDQEYFADGLAEELLNALVRIPGLRVAARVSAFSFKGKSTGIKEVGANLKVATILQGSVRKAGNRVRITAQLISVADGFHLWAESYDRRLDDIFEVQDDIARSVADALKVTLLAGTAPAAGPRAKSPEAYNLVLRGRYLARGEGRENLEKATAAYQKALGLDPTYAPAWAGLSDAYARRAGGGHVSLHEGFSMAREAAERALELDPTLPEAHAQLGWIKRSYDWDWTGSDEAYRRALALDPGNAFIISSAATLAAILGRLEEAISMDRKAVDLDPLSPWARMRLAIHLWDTDRPEEAAEAARIVIDLDPDFAPGHLNLGVFYLFQAKTEAALEEMRQVDSEVFRQYGLALAEHSAGRRAEADVALSELIDKFAGIAAVQIAEVYAWRGEVDQAFAWLDRAYLQRDPGLSESLIDPLLRKLEADPRWKAFLKKMRLPRWDSNLQPLG